MLPSLSRERTTSEDRLEGIEAEIRRLRDRKNKLQGTINELQTVIEFNEDLLDGNLDVFSDLQDDDDTGGSVTDELLSDGDTIVCWTCGSHTETSRIEIMLDNLRKLRDEHREESRGLAEEIDDLTDQRRQLEEQQRQRTRIDTRLETISDEIDERKSRADELKTRREDLTERIENLEAEVEQLRTEKNPNSELLDLHKEANRLEVEIDRLESDLGSVDDEIDRIEARVAERDELKAQRDEIQHEIERLRTRVETLEQNAVEQFNDHIETVLDLLAYENLERIWIERTEEQVRNGRRTVTKGRFDIHVVRSTESGSVYEDTVDHLSESERNVTGLVFALAGYLVHEVYEEIPFMLIDSVEAIDAPRLATLVDYFREHAEYLVVALLEEDAQALDDEYDRVYDI